MGRKDLQRIRRSPCMCCFVIYVFVLASLTILQTYQRRQLFTVSKMDCSCLLPKTNTVQPQVSLLTCFIVSYGMDGWEQVKV